MKGEGLTPAPCGIVTLTTDFGLADGYVGQMKGVLLGIARDLTIVDITHAVPAQAVASGGFLLAAAADAFPPGTIHLLVVDPGVGTDRRPMLARVGDSWFVGPDNGAWSYLARRAEQAGHPVQAWRLTNPAHWRPEVTATFHGRDLFAPVAARRARGAPPDDLGEPLVDPVRLALPGPERAGEETRGRIIHIDHFGNAITDLRPADLPAPPADCVIAHARVTARGIVRAYADAPVGAALALVGSFGTVELARRDGDAATTWGLMVGETVIVRAARSPGA